MTSPHATNEPDCTVQQTADRIYKSALTRLYSWIAAGLAITAVTSWAGHQAGLDTFRIFIMLTLASLGILILLLFTVDQLPTLFSTALYLVFTASERITLSAIFRAYTAETICLAFASTAVLFVAMSIVGHTTKKDISSWGTVLTAGLIALLN